MTTALPAALEPYLRALCIDDRWPCYLEVDRRGTVMASGGASAHYGLDGIQTGQAAAEVLDLLHGMLPLSRDHEFLPLCQVAGDCFAELHLIRGEASDWVLLLDATAAARDQQRQQQQAHDITLLHARESRLRESLQVSHAHLTAVLDQLELATAILDAAGRVVFLSHRGAELLVPGGGAGLPRPWREVLAFAPEDRPAIAALLECPPDERKRLRVRVQSGEGLPRRCELAVADDPRDRDGRILQVYDRSEIYDLRDLLEAKAFFHDMIGNSPEMQAMYELIQQVAQVNATVLIEGETGVGKELVARALYQAGPRRDGPLIVVNCAGLSDSLINSQLFGHKKGAFTDAVRDQEGLFEAAHGGTIFLDEIGDIPMNTQTRILRTLEQREITRIGETHTRHVDIRILAATNKDLFAESKAGRFREDLLYRIRVARISVPPLRRRRQDIPLLIKAFLRVLRAADGKPVSGVHHDTLRLLMDYAWPGNVRELRNAIEFAFIRCRDDTIRTEDLPPEIIALQDGRRAARDASVVDERERLLGALRAANGQRTEAAKLLGISRATFYRRLSACMLDPHDLA